MVHTISPMYDDAIAIACDHAGLDLKKQVIAHLKAANITVNDCGTHDTASVDYPDYAQAVARHVVDKDVGRGILICGSGIGMSMAANRHPSVRAALCHNVETAQLSREHNDANILVLGARIVSETEALACVDAFLTTAFAGGRHSQRIEKMS